MVEINFDIVAKKLNKFICIYNEFHDDLLVCKELDYEQRWTRDYKKEILIRAIKKHLDMPIVMREVYEVIEKDIRELHYYEMRESTRERLSCSYYKQMSKLYVNIGKYLRILIEGIEFEYKLVFKLIEF